MERHRRSSIGQFHVGDTQGSSIISAVVNNEVRARRSYSQHGAAPPVVRDDGVVEKPSMPRKPKSLFASYTWLLPLMILAPFYSTYFLVASDQPGHWMHRFVRLSYHVPGTSLYGKGVNDYFFVALHIVFFAWLREFCMQVALRPLAYVLGLRTKHKVNRFLEQAYSLFYYGVTGPVGLYIMKYRCPELWYFNTTAMYTGFPHREIDSWLKAFYLLQAAFWGQQALVLMLHLEKRRKDFQELVFHHIITVALIWLSYRFHFTSIGLLVYITMDVSDFFLALSKILNYLESPVVGAFFFLFVAAWVYLRHVLNIVILYSVATEFRTVGPFDLNWETQQYKCWISQYITFALLSLLQLVNLYWLMLVLKIAYRFLRHNVKEDVRSDNEGEEDD